MQYIGNLVMTNDDADIYVGVGVAGGGGILLQWPIFDGFTIENPSREE